MDKRLEMYYVQPAGRWEETLPVGNGSMGAMVWGGIHREMLGLNEESLWSGYERDKNNPKSYDSLQKVRDLIFSSKNREAEQVIRENMLGEYGESYLPLGNLNITYHNIGENVSPDNYIRRLDLEEAVAYVDFDVDGVHYHREIFATYPGKAVILFLSSSRPVMDLEISLDSELKCVMHGVQNGIGFTGKCPEHLDPSYVRKGEQAVIWGDKGKQFSGNIKILEGDGSILVEEDRIRIKGSSKAVLSIDAVRPCEVGGTYGLIKETHIKDYQEIFGKVELYLGEQLQQPTDVRLQALKDGGEDNGLFGLYFQYGRYLMIASSRKGSLPANLQGIWSWQFQAPWSCNWTTNINLEMNYWPVLSCGLEECMDPYFSFVEKLAENGKKTAAVNYHCRGSVHHHNADGWYVTSPMGIAHGEEIGGERSVVWSMWPMGMAWLTQGGKVKLLPALPKQFSSGYAKGIRIKGRQAVDLAWEDGKVVMSKVYDIPCEEIY